MKLSHGLWLSVSFRWACKIFGRGTARGGLAGSQGAAAGSTVGLSSVCR